MDRRLDDDAMGALLRLAAGRAGGAELALYTLGPTRPRLSASTSAAALAAEAGLVARWAALSPRFAPLLAAGGCARIDPGPFGLPRGFGALAAVRGADDGAAVRLLVAGDVRRRRLGPALAAALMDAARAAAPLLDPGAPDRRAELPPAAGPQAEPGLGDRRAGPQARGVLVRSDGAAAGPLGQARPASPGDDGDTPGALERDLAGAAGRGQLRLVYQGYLDLADGRLSGAEALLRWRHPLRGELRPAAFIPLAEASGLILPLGAWALRAALAAAAGWPRGLTLSVNVSALQFRQPGFVADIDAALAAAGVAPDRLELEITETVLMREGRDTTAQLEALVARGVRIALDDFGTGYSALAYLGRLPHQRIKLDRTFVQDLGNPATRELVRAITALARRTGVAVTAEGIERPDQLRLARDLGFTHAQGFVTGPPVEDAADLRDAPQPAL